MYDYSSYLSFAFYFLSFVFKTTSVFPLIQYSIQTSRGLPIVNMISTQKACVFLQFPFLALRTHTCQTIITYEIPVCETVHNFRSFTDLQIPAAGLTLRVEGQIACSMDFENGGMHSQAVSSGFAKGVSHNIRTSS